METGCKQFLRQLDAAEYPKHGRPESCFTPSFLSTNRPIKRSSYCHISTWPAYGAEHTILQKRKPCTAPVGNYDRTTKQNVNVVSKPRFLEQLESYLRRELQSLDLTKENSQELRLQAYREVFNYFIDAFKTYKPLLSAIKNEYEVTVALQRQQIYSLGSLKTMLVSVSEECDQRIQAMYQDERLEIKTLKIEKQGLLKMIDKMKEENSYLHAQVSKLQEELANAYLLYRNESDARKLLITEINDLKYQQDTMKTSSKNDELGEDPVTLALALKVSRKDLAQAQAELNRIKADYGDVVPRRDFNNQEKKLTEFSQKIETLQKDLSLLQTEYNSLLEIHNQIVQKDSANISGEDQYHPE
uniref:Translin-associated factor X-interacting protein 1 N-terminal domain-containing protein n=1 Tax=Leptobrachium leishanense TaxID=445787 RepID=A0A8C5N2F0_9ANUR